MSKQPEHTWKDVKVLLNGKEIPVKPVQLNEGYPLLKWKYYCHRGNKYFFVNEYGSKIAIESDDKFFNSLKYRATYEFNLN